MDVQRILNQPQHKIGNQITNPRRKMDNQEKKKKKKNEKCIRIEIEQTNLPVRSYNVK